MKVNHFLPMAALCLMTMACQNEKAVETTAGIRTENLDTTAVAGTDFYQYACGGWMKNNPLPAEFSRFGSFDKLAEDNRAQIQGLIEELAAQESAPGSVAQKIGTLYRVAMDSVKLNKDGAAPLKERLQQIASVKEEKDLYYLLGEMQKRGVGAYVAVYVGADEKNSSMNAVQTYQIGLSMGERDYYLEDTENSKRIRTAFLSHVEKMYKLAGMDDATAKRGAALVMDIETRLAKAYRSRTELRDPHANYNKMTMDEAKALCPTFGWDAFLAAMDFKDVKEIIIGQPASLQAAAEILHTTPVADQTLYLQWKTISNAASMLSDEFAEENFNFFGRTMRGAQQMQPRWKRAVAVVSGSLGEAVGQMYVEKYFPAEAKERMITLVRNLQESLGERIQALEWMGDSTKVKALEKLATFHVKIGYPDKWKDYSTLDIKDDSFIANMERANLWSHAEMLDKVGKPVDKEEWHMTPQTVNAYYNPTTNEICFPAGILQYPFFDMNADDAFNYGAIGVVIGHEMTHGFDDQGRKYDKDGNLKDWWTEQDAKNFDERAKVMIDFFDKIEVAPGVNANGQMTLGENIADHGGLQIAYQAFKKATAQNPLGEKDGFTPEQRFFLAYANVWAGNIRPEEILNRTKTDVHSLGKWRVNGALPHINAWYEAFGITEN
ncbi:MAG: M13 family metallopeptidase, partial [Bacteroidaceae bacterium]|nr:M13 family metallopeptidase [Bacteroidaceae bacterium]